MRLNRVLVIALALSSDCGGGSDLCRCRGPVPGGTLDLFCGGSACLSGHGYRCVRNDAAESAADACSLGGGGAPDLAPPSCAPSCDGRVCGDDGCHSSYGSCASGTTCQSGQCV